MTTVSFLSDSIGIIGFDVKGHSSFDCKDEEGRLVCSAVSSALYLTANTVTEIIGDECDISLSDADFVLKAKSPSRETRLVLKGLVLHLKELSLQYSSRVKIYGGVDDVKD